MIRILFYKKKIIGYCAKKWYPCITSPTKMCFICMCKIGLNIGKRYSRKEQQFFEIS